VTKVHGDVTVTLVRAGWSPMVLVCTEGVCAPTGSGGVTVTKVHGGVTVTLVRAGWLPVVLVCTEGVCAPTGSSQVSVWSDVYRADLYSECVSRGV
jgi:hypothetical protein